MRARTFLFLTLPALFLVETTAHTALTQAFDPATARHAPSPQSGPSYGPQPVAVRVTLAGAVRGRHALAFRAEGRQPLPRWRLAALPMVGFLAQEHLERIVQYDQVGWLTTLEPVVLIGVGLQLPCGLLAVWLVRTLLRAAERLGCTLTRRGSLGQNQPE